MKFAYTRKETRIEWIIVEEEEEGGEEEEESLAIQRTDEKKKVPSHIELTNRRVYRPTPDFQCYILWWGCGWAAGYIHSTFYSFLFLGSG